MSDFPASTAISFMSKFFLHEELVLRALSEFFPEQGGHDWCLGSLLSCPFRSLLV